MNEHAPNLYFLGIGMHFRNFGVAAALVMAAASSLAVPVQYSFNGLLTADYFKPFSRTSLVDVPFSVTLLGESNDAIRLGSGVWANPGLAATWNVQGLAPAKAAGSQIYSRPGMARIGFGWGGPAIPSPSQVAAPLTIAFIVPAAAMDSAYGRLASVVPTTHASLYTSFRNPVDTIPEFSTFMSYDDGTYLVLKDMTSISYSVSAVPEPNALASILLGTALVLSVSRRTTQPRNRS